MADTRLLKDRIEPHVRKWLTQKYNLKFESQEIALKLITGGQHRFDAVSKDRSMVAGIKSSRLRNYKSKRSIGTGTIKAVFTELYYLSLVEVNRKALILTNKGFYDLFCKKSKGKVAKGIEILYCPLTEEIEAETLRIHDACSREIGKQVERRQTKKG